MQHRLVRDSSIGISMAFIVVAACVQGEALEVSTLH
jgi:hypothetical protein